MRAKDNHFRSARIDALSFRPQGIDWSTLMRRLQELDYRAAVVGPRGSGKTTLLQSLVPRLRSLELQPRLLFFNAETPAPSLRELLREVREPGDRAVLLVDGFDHLPRGHAWLLRRAVPRLIVAGHRPSGLPTLMTTRTNPELLSELLDELQGPEPSAWRPLAEDFHRRHSGNLREAFRELYDRAAGSGRT